MRRSDTCNRACRRRAHGVCSRDPEGELLGFAVGHLERSGSDDHFLLKEMCVRPSRQRKGHGTGLLRALAEYLDDVPHWYLLTARRARGLALQQLLAQAAERMVAWRSARAAMSEIQT